MEIIMKIDRVFPKDELRSLTSSKNSEIVESVEALVPLLDSFSDLHDRSGEISPEIISTFEKHELFWILMPKTSGGLGLSPLDALAVIEAVSYGDGASGWVLMATSLGTSLAAGYLASDAVAELFGGENRAIICGHGAPSGRAVPVEGGYRITGKWSYGSGIRYATHLHCGGIVYDGDAPRRRPDGSVDMRQFVIPRDEAIYDGNWEVLGLRATGSIDYSIDGAFVPESYTQPSVSRDTRAGEIFGLGIVGIATIGHTAFALGVGRRALEELAAYARIGKGPFPSLAEREGFLESLARHEGRLRAARAFVRETWQGIENVTKSGKASSMRQETLIRLAMLEATEAAAEAAYFAYRTAGGAALRAGVIQRFFRDMLAGTQHQIVSTAHLRECGREIAGDGQGKHWNGFGLADVPRPA
jgi:alkylation response protein AidB-like acyl-CoA dehydrogenase